MADLPLDVLLGAGGAFLGRKLGNVGSGDPRLALFHDLIDGGEHVVRIGPSFAIDRRHDHLCHLGLLLSQSSGLRIQFAMRLQHGTDPHAQSRVRPRTLAHTDALVLERHENCRQ